MTTTMRPALPPGPVQEMLAHWQAGRFEAATAAARRILLAEPEEADETFPQVAATPRPPGVLGAVRKVVATIVRSQA